jgi:hypothetical protein
VGLYVIVSLALIAKASYELWAGKNYGWAGVTRSEKPWKYWRKVIWKIVVAVVLTILAIYHFLPGS